jgi:outer membrane immunogenic protein
MLLAAVFWSPVAFAQ